MFIYQSKVNLDEKILFGSIPHLTDPEIRIMLVKDMFGNKNSTFHSGPWFILYWNWNSASQTGNVNLWNVEFSIPLQTPHKHFDFCWVLKIFDITKQNFLIWVSLWVIDEHFSF